MFNPFRKSKEEYKPVISLHDVVCYKTGKIFRVRGKDGTCSAIKPQKDLVEALVMGDSMGRRPLVQYVNYFRVINGRACLESDTPHGDFIIIWFYDQVKEMFLYENNAGEDN